MYSKTIEYVDFNGNERSDKLYFHLSLPEVTRIEAEIDNSLKDHITSLIANRDKKTLLDFLERIILTSYGERTQDGRTFKKNEQITSDFENSLAYAEFFEQIITEEGMAQSFGEKVADNGQNRKNEVQPEVIN